MSNEDNKDLEDLFDSVASQYEADKNKKDSSDKEEDLEALFDRVAAETKNQSSTEDVVKNVEPKIEDKQTRVFNKVGNMVRTLHNTLGEIGVDKVIEQAVSTLPDTKDRLAYIATLTEQAASKVLNSLDLINPLVDDVVDESKLLGNQWDKAFDGELTLEEFKELAKKTRSHLKESSQKKLSITREQLTEIMMAQDFQDLTGQVIKKIVALTHELENGLMSVLVDVVPEDLRNSQVIKVDDLMNGPVVKHEGRTDVVVNQKQVDDLLDSLGF